jgi:two-component system, OmpR family, phosphate regulon sensor histidine kinase PhoR
MDAHARAAAALAALPSGVIALDQHEQITLITPAAARLLDLDADRWLGQPFAALGAHLALPPTFGAQLTYVQRPEAAITFRFLRPSASVQSPAVGTLVLIEPTTAEQQAINDVMRTISSEFRTPLTIIFGYTKLLCEDKAEPLQPVQREFLEYIAHQGANLRTLVNDTLLAYDLALGRMPVHTEPYALAAAIQFVQHSPLWGTPVLPVLVLDLPPDLPPVLVDPSLLHPLLAQLLAWARHRTYEGEPVVVRVQTHASMLVMTITSTGLPMRPEERAHLDTLFSTTHVVPFRPSYEINGHLFFAHQLTVLNNGTLALIDEAAAVISIQLTLPRAHTPETL